MNLKKILIVEDSELLHRMYNLIFLRHKSNGLQLISALNGREGLSKLQEHADTDLILLDINMPEMSGLEFLHQIKKEKSLQNIPVIIVSTEGSEEDTLRGLEAGATAYIKKPFQPSNIIKMVSRIAEMKHEHAGLNVVH